MCCTDINILCLPNVNRTRNDDDDDADADYSNAIPHFFGSFTLVTRWDKATAADGQ